MESDAEFYRRRVAEERRAMDKADTPEARELHRVMAEGYAAKLKELAEANDLIAED